MKNFWACSSACRSDPFCMAPLIALFIALTMMFAAPARNEGAETHRLVIITGKAGTIGDISRDDLRQIYTARISRLGGYRISPVILGSREPAERYFLEELLGIAEIDFTQLWIGAVFRGEVGAPPHLARAPADACLYVATHRNAIGFVEASDLSGDVKAITVDGRRYDAPEYPLKWSAR